jgi:hypothetical protein
VDQSGAWRMGWLVVEREQSLKKPEGQTWTWTFQTAARPIGPGPPFPKTGPGPKRPETAKIETYIRKRDLMRPLAGEVNKTW